MIRQLQRTMKSNAHVILGLAVGCILCCLACPAGEAQEPGQTSLGDVVRHQQADHQHAKAAKRVLTDDDMPASRMLGIAGVAASMKIIPCIGMSATVPGYATTPWAADPKPKKMYAWFGPSLDECGDLDCAEAIYLRDIPRTFGGRTRILYESDDIVQGYPARVAHLEVLHDVRGKLVGSVALVQTPEAAFAVTCLYHPGDTSEVETDCDAVLASIQVRFPAKYIYVQHNH